MQDVHRYRIKLTKLNELKFISHLDWQNLILKSLRRAGVKLALSEGFNPMPKVSCSSALPLFIESECELVNFITTQPVAETFEEDFQKSVSKNVKILNFSKLPYSEKRLESLETLVQWAKYEAIPNKTEGISKCSDLGYTIDKCLSGDDFFIKKVNKKGIEKNINYRNSIRSVEVLEGSITFTLKTGQGSDIPPLRADEFIRVLFGDESTFDIKRTHLFDIDLKELS